MILDLDLTGARACSMARDDSFDINLAQLITKTRTRHPVEALIYRRAISYEGGFMGLALL